MAVHRQVSTYPEGMKACEESRDLPCLRITLFNGQKTVQRQGDHRPGGGGCRRGADGKEAW